MLATCYYPIDNEGTKSIVSVRIETRSMRDEVGKITDLL
jgi:hypothetical protein